MTDFWGEYAAAEAEGGSVKLNAEGDVFEGVLAEIKVTRFENGGNAITLVADDGRWHHASTVDAKRKLSEAKPEVGDAVRIKLVSLMPNKHGGKSKIFDVSVVKAQAPATGSEPPF